jgi:TonB family protein
MPGRKWYHSIGKKREIGFLSQVKGMLLFSFLGHIILFILAIYIPFKFQHHRVDPMVYNVNLVDFIEKKSNVPRSASKHIKKRRVEKTSSSTKKAKPKEIKKVTPEKPKTVKKPKRAKKPVPSKKKPKKAKKSLPNRTRTKATMASTKKPKPTKTTSPDTSNPNEMLAAHSNKIDLRGGYRGSLSIDNINFPFTYYLLLIRDKISRNWNPDFGPLSLSQGQQVVIAFKIRKDGSISEPYIEKSSGMAYLDQSALRAVLSSVPLPPLPREFGEEYLGVHFGFEYTEEG